MLEGKVAIITGSAGGVGRYVAKKFAGAGAMVVVTDIKPLDTVSEELKQMEADFLAVPTDVSDEASVRNLMDRTLERFGRIDVLHNNAGVVTHFYWGNVPAWPKVRDMDKSFWDKVVGSHLGGTFLCTKYALPAMESQRSGHIINVPGGGQPTTIGANAYVTAKEAVRTFTRYVAEEEREFGICIVAMGPGGIIATEEAPEEARERLATLDVIGDRHLLAAEAPMEMSGKILNVEDGKLVARD